MTDSITVTPDPADNNGQIAFNTSSSNATFDPNLGNTGTGFLVGTQPAPATQRTTAPQGHTLTPEEIAALGAQGVAPQLQQITSSQQTMEQRMAAMQAEIDLAKSEREAAQTAAADAEAARLAAETAAAEQGDVGDRVGRQGPRGDAAAVRAASCCR